MFNKDGMLKLIKKPLEFFRKSGGNISILVLTLLLLSGFILALLFDYCRIFNARTQAKNASDSAALAISQNLIFFDEENILEIVEAIVHHNDCNIIKVNIEYNEAIVEVTRVVNFILIDKLGFQDCRVFSSSSSRVIYPWDQVWEACGMYKFEY